MDQWVQMVVTVVCAVAASSGFWTLIQKKCDKKDVTREMLIGLAHDRIVSLGVYYLERGDWITRDEYENLKDYLYAPYEKIGGNGSAVRVMAAIDTLRIVPSTYVPTTPPMVNSLKSRL